MKEVKNMIKKLAMLTAVGMMLTGCYATTGQVKKDMITLGGCASGGLVGSQVGSGSGRTVAIIAGTISGCHLGKAAAKKVVDKD